MSTSVQEATALAGRHEAPGTLENHDADLAAQTKNLSINGSRPASIAQPNGQPISGELGSNSEAHLGSAFGGNESTYTADQPNGNVEGEAERPQLTERPSRSYVKPIPIVTTYEQDPPEAAPAPRRSASRAGSVKAPSVKAASVKAPSVAPAGTKAPSIKRAPSKAGSVKAPSIRNSVAPTSPSIVGTDHHMQQQQQVPQYSAPRSARNSIVNGAGVGAGAGAGAAAIGEVFSHERQREMQQPNQRDSGISLQDRGPVPRDRSTTFEDQSGHHRSMSPRPRSQFGHRPEPILHSVAEDGRESGYDNGRESRAGVLGRSGTVVSRANTMGRNGTLSRTLNGGIAGSRRGAFGRGAGTSIGTQPEEVLGRDDIHSRAELSERILGESALKRLSTMEKKDASRLAKVIKTEAKAEAKAVQGSIKELERLVKLQKEAASAERKSQMRLTKWTAKEHKARLRFLKEKERYEKIEGDLRNAENDYEERRDHAAGLTAQVAEKTQDLDDLRAQKAADDREREVKLLALKNPAHS